MNDLPKIPDPVHNSIKIPVWLTDIENRSEVRRMMFIRQLGLKAYVDFPGAIHTRYSHVLGAMHLAGILVDKLIDKSNSDVIKETLSSNRNNIMAAGFLHDIGHGPFSHAVDFVLKTILQKNHEKISGDIIEKLDELEKYGISKNAIIKIINKRHEYPFIADIINGPLDVDKLDYLLRDAHHVGLRYGFDLEYFIDNYKILGNYNEPKNCKLGLMNKDEAIVTCEIFVLIWRNMYELVYYKQNSRIAEKMLEKAVLLAIQDNCNDVKSFFTNIDRFIELYDDKLLDMLSNCNNNYIRNVVNGIRTKNLFKPVRHNFDFKEQETLNKEQETNFYTEVINDPDTASDKLSLKLCERMRRDRYEIIADIITTKKPHEIDIEINSNEEPLTVNEKSDIISAIKHKNILKIYVEPTRSIKSEDLNKNISTVIKEW